MIAKTASLPGEITDRISQVFIENKSQDEFYRNQLFDHLNAIEVNQNVSQDDKYHRLKNQINSCEQTIKHYAKENLNLTNQLNSLISNTASLMAEIQSLQASLTALSVGQSTSTKGLNDKFELLALDLETLQPTKTSTPPQKLSQPNLRRTNKLRGKMNSSTTENCYPRKLKMPKKTNPQQKFRL